MATRSHEREVAAGGTLVADVSLLAVPFAWAAVVPSGVELAHDYSMSEEPGGWLQPATNATITATVADSELDPIRFLRWRHVAGSDAAAIRINGEGRVRWIPDA